MDWGPDFALRHGMSFPEITPSLFVNLGPLGLSYLLSAGGSGYFRMHAVQPHIASGRLHLVPGTPQFSYPVYVVHSANADDDVLGPALAGLRTVSADTPRIVRIHLCASRRRTIALSRLNLPIKSWSSAIDASHAHGLPRRVERFYRLASFSILRSKEGDDRLSSVIFTDGSPGQSTALTKPCRDLALIARGGFMLRCRNGFAALRHIGWRRSWYRVVAAVDLAREPAPPIPGWPEFPRPARIRSRASPIIRLRAARWAGVPQPLWRPALPGGASRGVRLRPCRSVQSPPLRRAR